MPSTRHLQSTARLALLAMFLLLAAPLLSQGLARAQTDGLPSWLDELACGDAAPAHHGSQPLWAKCGYCTLLLSSPAVPGALVDLGGVADALAVGIPLSLAGTFMRRLAPHDAPPRAPPHSHV
ncbi:DUF2946 family protein [Pseudomonas sp. zbq_18]|uniref:DUF2946 family protein n=1 Tax=Pseudomonadota TaxID=1224 RepID=UPI00370B3E63